MYPSNPLSEKRKTTVPLLLHVDMDSFFASLEIRSDPRLKGLPVVVGGGPGPRGVIAAASYPARVFGIHSGMALSRAQKLCPTLIVLPVNASKVVHESLAIINVLERFSQRVHPASIDEAYVLFDAVEPDHWSARAAALATEIQMVVHQTRGLTCSIGAGCNRLQSKIASAQQKPFGITVVPPGSFYEMFKHKPANIIPGIGTHTYQRLKALGIRTLQDIVQADPAGLAAHFGTRYAGVLHELARGIDDRVPQFHPGDEAPKSASHEMTFAQDISDGGYLQAAVSLLADRVARRLRRSHLYAGVVGVRYTVGTQKRSRQKKLFEPTHRAQDLSAVAWPLLQKARQGKPLRLVGVCGMQLTTTGPLPSLFGEDPKETVLTQASDSLRDRFGEQVLMPARTYWKGSSRGHSRLRGWHSPEGD